MTSPIEYSCVFNHGIDLLYAYGTEVQIVYLESSERIIKQRNARHDTTLNNAGIDKMLCHWEVPVPTEVHEARYYPADFEVARGKIAQSSQMCRGKPPSCFQEPASGKMTNLLSSNTIVAQVLL